MGRPRAGSRGLNEALHAEARRWAEESCLDQQLPVKVTDGPTVLDIALLVSGTSSSEPLEQPLEGREAA